MSDRTLTADEITTICRLMWGSRFSAESEDLGDFLGINHRNALRLLSGEMNANAGISAELRAEFRAWLTRSPSPAAAFLRESLAADPQMITAGTAPA